MAWGGASAVAMEVVTAFVVLALEWYLCYWLYERKIFIRI
jgi:hypothetical protein